MKGTSLWLPNPNKTVEPLSAVESTPQYISLESTVGANPPSLTNPSSADKTNIPYKSPDNALMKYPRSVAYFLPLNYFPPINYFICLAEIRFPFNLEPPYISENTQNLDPSITEDARSQSSTSSEEYDLEPLSLIPLEPPSVLDKIQAQFPSRPGEYFVEVFRSNPPPS